MQNWNDGKTQEFKDRRVYDIANSHLNHAGVKDAAPVAAAAAPQDFGCDATYLFATATCPNCKIACAALDKAGVAYQKILANEQPDMAEKFGIRQAPTLVIVKDGGITKFAGVSEIKKFLN